MDIHVRYLAALFLGVVIIPSAGGAADEITSGYTDFPPLFYRDSNGQPGGFAVDVVNRAASEAGVTVRWKWVPRHAVLEAIDRGEIQLYAAALNTDYRRARYHLTRPWWQSSYVVVTQASTDVSVSNPLRVAHVPDLPADFSRMLGRWSLMRVTGSQELLPAMCRGEIDGFLIDRVALHERLLNRPAVCANVAIKVTDPTSTPLPLSVLAAKDQAHLAERINTAIQDLANNGELTRLALRYPEVLASSGSYLAALVQNHSRNLALRVTVAVLSVVLLFCAWLIVRLRRDVGHRRRTAAELQRAYQDLAQFAYASHHDLREPLRNMRLFSQMLQRRGLDDPRAPEHLSYIARGAERMSSLLDAVRAYMQIAPLADDPELDPVDALADAVGRLQPLLRSAGAEVHFGAMPPVQFNRDHLAEVFSHLIENSIKFRSAAKPAIHVEAVTVDRQIHFSVRDNGSGIAPEYQQKVFGVFKRLHGHDVAGTGIGLAICRKIIENRHGRIWIQSQTGQGTTVFFTTPRAVRGPKLLKRRSPQ